MIRTEALLHFRWGQGVCDQNGPGCSVHEAEHRRPGFKEQAQQYLPANLPPRRRLSHWQSLTNIPQRSLKWKESSGAGWTGKDWPELPGRTPQPTLGPSEFCVAKTWRISINDSLKKHLLSFCFDELLFTGHIFYYLKTKCLVRNTILIIKSFTWEKSCFTLWLPEVVCGQEWGGVRSTTQSDQCQNSLSAFPCTLDSY